ncbi:hypothetical protein GRF29_19g3110879 [Pseudopithomyces chartarum]|uniref:Uncharacterized protein n=1 Tax=Pseudopithomyces chartarum TaxID=1892770 RepID=A0AAN6M405_9PLEO|nr:hypothetical protein GRF29_19g3110879 [Pseudopithomyces chartarum]
MLPPVEPTVFERNPNFEVLYKDLCTRKLNADGSTRDTKKQRIHAEIRQDLTTHRTNAHMTYLLTTTLSNLPSLAPSLPPDLHIPIALITALLTGKIPPKDHPILTPDTQVFLSNADIIASALSTHLQQTASLLCTLSSPLSPPPPSSLPTTASSLRTDASQVLPSTLSSSKTHLSNSAHEVLSLHLALLHAAILILERTQHGALARSTAATAENHTMYIQDI